MTSEQITELVSAWLACARRAKANDALDGQVRAHVYEKCASDLESFLMANGLTEAETSATPSCAGLTVKPWLDWKGGECPTRWTETVEIRFRDGNTDIDFAQAYDWSWCDLVDDIVAYRVL